MTFNPEDPWNSPFFDKVATEWRQARGGPPPRGGAALRRRPPEPRSDAVTALRPIDGPTVHQPGSDAELLVVIEAPLTWDEKEEIRDNALSACDKLEAAAENAVTQLRLTPAARLALALALEEGQRIGRAALRLGR
jgi:hypothetical protein